MSMEFGKRSCMRILRWLVRKIDYFKFCINYPKVKFIKPQKSFTYFSQYGQDLYLSALLFKFLGKRDAYFFDVGCNDPIRFSNSYFFEKFFGFKTIAIDPLIEYQKKWSSHRPGAKFIPVAVGDEEGVSVLHVPDINSMYDDMFSSIKSIDSKVSHTCSVQRVVECRTLENIFESLGIDCVDIISIDVEGFEMNVLKGINFEKVSIKCFLVENNTKSLFGADDVREYLKGKGYIFHSRIGYVDDVFLHNSLEV